MSIEQAIFTSATTDRTDGYHLLARSPGLTESDARELSVWSPSHDSLLPGRRASTNFFPLRSGAYGIARTTMAEPEYSGRGGARVHTHVIVTPASTLERFGNNPFFVLRAALAIGALGEYEATPRQLYSLVLGGRAPTCDTGLKSQMIAQIGEAGLEKLLEALLHADQLAIVGAHDYERLFAGLINCLSPERRIECSFATGLRCSPRRPFRLISIERDPGEFRRLARQGISIFDFDQVAPLPLDSILVAPA